MRQSRKLALTGMLCALAVCVMMLGNLIPLATFCCPALAGLMLIPVFVECGEKASLCAYVVIALLSLILSPDKESALLFLFLGYYPVLRWRVSQIRSALLRVLAKLAAVNLAAALTYLCGVYAFGLSQIAAEYRAMGLTLGIATLVIANVTMLIYDRLLVIMTGVYVNRLRKKFKG